MKSTLPEHIESRECWCEPECLQPCPECDKDPECWKCGGRGLVTEYDNDAMAIIVHRGEGMLPHPEGDEIQLEGGTWESPWAAIIIVLLVFAAIILAELNANDKRTKGDGLERRPSALEEYQRVWRGI